MVDFIHGVMSLIHHTHQCLKVIKVLHCHQSYKIFHWMKVSMVSEISQETCVIGPTIVGLKIGRHSPETPTNNASSYPILIHLLPANIELVVVVAGVLMQTIYGVQIVITMIPILDTTD